MRAFFRVLMCPSGVANGGLREHAIRWEVINTKLQTEQ